MRRVLLSRGEHARHEGCGMNVKRERKRGRLNPDKGLVGIASFNCIPSPWLFIVRICEREKRRGKKKVVKGWQGATLNLCTRANRLASRG